MNSSNLSHLRAVYSVILCAQFSSRCGRISAVYICNSLIQDRHTDPVTHAMGHAGQSAALLLWYSCPFNPSSPARARGGGLAFSSAEHSTTLSVCRVAIVLVQRAYGIPAPPISLMSDKT
jgi:hypothetical protein